eukprot:3271793-Karenia_brevis.AAC.1
MAPAKTNDLRMDGEHSVDPLFVSDPWASTPLASTRPADGTSRNWPAWPAAFDFTQKNLPQFQMAPAR